MIIVDLCLRENVSRCARKNVDEGNSWRPVPGVFRSHVRFQLVEQGFDDGSLAK